MSSSKERISRTIGDLLEIPQDIVLDLPRITIIGRSEMLIENHRGIIEYGLNRLRVSISRGFLEIEGENLEIKALMSEEIKVIGVITLIRYVD